MTRLLELPRYLEKWGLEVELVPGWESRGRDFERTPEVVLGHHTATPNTSKNAHLDLPTKNILVNGRSDLPGPLCQVGGGRSGKAYVIASGKANHAGQGGWGGVTASGLTVGIEMEHPGTGGWDPKQLRCFDLIGAALLDMLGQKASAYCGHREWALPAGRKVDPGGVDLRLQRERIQTHLSSGHSAPVAPNKKEITMFLVDDPGPAPDGAKQWLCDAQTKRHVKDWNEVLGLRQAGVPHLDEKPETVKMRAALLASRKDVTA